MKNLPEIIRRLAAEGYVAEQIAQIIEIIEPPALKAGPRAGGIARAKALPAGKRIAIAKKAAKTRWGKNHEPK